VAKHKGNNGYVKISTNTVAEMVDWSLTEGIAVIDNTVVGDTYDTHETGTKNWSGSVSCYWDETDSTGQEAMTIGVSVELHLLPDGESANDIDFNGTATITSIERGGANNGMVTANFSFQGNGALTRSVLT
jgi:hypothetical protein